MAVITSAVSAVIVAVFPLLGAFGIHLDQTTQTAIRGLVVTVLSAIAGVAGLTTTPTTAVVERTPDGQTALAGTANELPTGVRVRDSLESR